MKAILKVYIKGKRKPLFECDITEDPKTPIDELSKSLNSDSRFIDFHQVGFDKEMFSHYEIIYK